ncbi:hypothetical protein M422DRAFT_41450 [Sphaerobolus stellatus SS14]|nr:hypothetical protein M422DRAFT_41450 [Sphaerobolus stellatus SS14]
MPMFIQVKKHLRLYCSNGDLVILAPSSVFPYASTDRVENRSPVKQQEGWKPVIVKMVAFRVDSIRLKNMAVVFKDMLAFADGKTECVDTFEGVPVVRVHDSSAEFAVFLDVLGNTHQIENWHMTIKTISKIDVLLRLGDKYVIDHLRPACIQALRNAFPKDLFNWETSSMRRYESLLEKRDWVCIPDLMPDPNALFRVIHDNNIEELLRPLQYYAYRVRRLLSREFLPRILNWPNENLLTDAEKEYLDNAASNIDTAIVSNCREAFLRIAQANAAYCIRNQFQQRICSHGHVRDCFSYMALEAYSGGYANALQEMGVCFVTNATFARFTALLQPNICHDCIHAFKSNVEKGWRTSGDVGD